MAKIERDADGIYTGPGEKTIPLRTALKREGAPELTSITIQEPNAKQLSDYFGRINSTNDDGHEALIHLISATSGVPIPDVQKLKQRDFGACGDFLAVFTPAPPPKSAPSAN